MTSSPRSDAAALGLQIRDALGSRRPAAVPSPAALARGALARLERPRRLSLVPGALGLAVIGGAVAVLLFAPGGGGGRGDGSGGERREAAAPALAGDRSAAEAAPASGDPAPIARVERRITRLRRDARRARRRAEEAYRRAARAAEEEAALVEQAEELEAERARRRRLPLTIEIEGDCDAADPLCGIPRDPGTPAWLEPDQPEPEPGEPRPLSLERGHTRAAAARAPRPAAARPRDRAAISAAISRAIPTLRSCARQAGRTGTVILDLFIAADGTVRRADRGGSSTGFGHCVDSALVRARLPRAGRGMHVRYPLVVRPDGG